MSIASPSRYDKEFSTSLFDCTEICCSPLWCNALWCKGVVWGQILTRLKLSYWGARDGMSYKHTFIVFVCLWIAYLITRSIAKSVQTCVRKTKASDLDPADECALALGGLAWLAALTLTIMMCIGQMKARNYFRRRTGIKSTCYTCDDEGFVDDCLCVTFCGCCTAIQMIRETQEGHTYNCCCHKTGYPTGVDVLLFEDDDSDGGNDTDDSTRHDGDDDVDVENQNSTRHDSSPSSSTKKKMPSIGKQSTPKQQYGQLPHQEIEAELTDMKGGVMG